MLDKISEWLTRTKWRGLKYTLQSTAIIVKFVDFNDGISNTAGLCQFKESRQTAFVVCALQQNPLVSGKMCSRRRSFEQLISCINRENRILLRQYPSSHKNTKSLLSWLEGLSALFSLRHSTRAISYKYLLKWLVKEINYEQNADCKHQTGQQFYPYIYASFSKKKMGFLTLRKDQPTVR